MEKADLFNLPMQTCQFIERLLSLGLDQTRIHGFFVMLGIYAGSPNTQETIDNIFSNLNLFLPTDRSKNIDEVVGHLYDGYDRELNEFCYRSGIEFEFRKISIPNVDKTISIVNLRDEGLLNTDVKTIEKLVDANRLFDAFLIALGKSSVKRNANLLEAFTLGIFQIQLHAKFDVSGARQVAFAIKNYLPYFYSRCFKALLSGQVEYFLELQNDQISLIELMQETEPEYAKQMWGFQSYLFFKQGVEIDGVSNLSPFDWHQWVLDRGRHFSKTYPNQLIPFSRSNITLSEIPDWNGSIAQFETCDKYINKVWGLSAVSILNRIELLDYRALVVHLIYSSLTSSPSNCLYEQ